MIQEGEEALLAGDLDKANWVLDSLIFLDPARSSELWQRGLSLYYSHRYEEGMAQFEKNMDTNGSDPEEVLWHFFCKSRVMGFEEARRDGFLKLLSQTDSEIVVPMSQVLDLFHGKGSVDEVMRVATSVTPNNTIESYNGADALGYAHFYIGLYYQLQGLAAAAYPHFKLAAEISNKDYMGRLMSIHFKTFLKTLCQDLTLIGGGGGGEIMYGGWQLSSGHDLTQVTQGSGSDTVTILSKLLEAIDNGVRVFDCGDIYTGVELLYGRLIEVHTGRGGKREDIKIHTKLVPDLDVIKRGGVNESYVRGVIQRSLNRLKSLYVDLVQLHWWEWSSSGVMDALSVLGSLQREGIVRNIGLTNFNAEQTKEILGGTGIRINSIQVQLSVIDQRPIKSGLVTVCNENDIKIFAYGVLAGGFLTDQWIGKPKPSDFSNRSLVKYQLIIDEFGSWDLFQDLLSVLHSVALSHSPLTVQATPDDIVQIDHVTVAMVAIAYVLRLPEVGGVILGTLNMSHLRESLLAKHLVLSDKDLSDIDHVLNKGRGPGGVVYGLERDREDRHGSIMKYNLNQWNSSAHFDEICNRFIEVYFSAYPVEATRTGYCPFIKTLPNIKLQSPSPFLMKDAYSNHSVQCLSYDHLLNISSEDQVASYIDRVRALLIEIESISEDNLSLDQIIDRKLIISQLNLELVKWLEVAMHERDPAIYMTFDALNYLLPTWRGDSNSEKGKEDAVYYPGTHSLSIHYRLSALLSRLRQIPINLQNGVKNLKKPIHLLTQRALKLCDSFSHFLRVDLPSLAEQMSTAHSSLLLDIGRAAKVASDAVLHYKSLLATDVLPRSSDSYASLGRAVYDKLLAFGHFISDSSALLKSGEEHFSLVKKQLRELAVEIDPDRNWYQITEDIIRSLHPTAENLLQSYLEEIARAKTHMKEHRLVPDLPADERVIGFYTPSFLVPFSPFGDFLNPPPFSSYGTSPLPNNPDLVTGYLMLHSVAGRSLSPPEEEKLLRSHDYTWISVIAPHECYPGHHFQILFSQTHPRIMRRFYESPYFYEGWGLYCEQLAFETGFFNKELEIRDKREESEVRRESKKIPNSQYERLSRLTQLRLQLWRAARVILDIKLHRNEMTLEDVRLFLLQEILFDSRSVDGEVYMYISRPTYAPCYIAGYLELMDLRERRRKECEEEKRDFDLSLFHSEVLQSGCLPFPLLNEILSVRDKH